MNCPYCGSDDVFEDEPRPKMHVTTCVECEANALNGMWSSPKAIRRARAADADVLRRFEDQS